MASKWWTVVRCVGLALLVASALTLGVSEASAQSSELAEAKDLYDRGQDDAGLAKLQEILASDLSQEEAFELSGEVDYSFWLDLLVLGGEHEQAALAMLDLATAEENERRADEGAIRDLVAQLASDDVAERNQARLRLSADHGSYAVPEILRVLASTDSSEYRINLLYTLTQLGSEAVPALVEALRSSNESTRLDVILVLGNIRDMRASGYLKRHLELGNPDQAEADIVEDSLERMGLVGGSARNDLLGLANRYLQNDPDVVRNLQSTRPVWRFEDGGLVSDVSPLYLYHLLMAEKAAYEALEVAPGDEEVLETLATAMLRQKAALEAAAEAGADTSAAQARVTRAVNLATAGDTSMKRDALRRAMREESPEVVIEGIEALAATTSGAELAETVSDGLDSNDKRVRYVTAIALAKDNPSDLGANTDKVVATLVQAVGEESVRTVLVIDDNDDTRNAVLGAVEEMGAFGMGAKTGIDGIQRAKSLPGADLYVIRAGMKDLSVERMLRNFSEDFRTKNTPVVLLADESDSVSVQNTYSGRVAGVVTGPDADAMREAMGDDSNDNRQRAQSAASKAAAALHLVAHAGNVSLDQAVPALVGTLDRPDVVRLDAIRALGYIGSTEAVPGLVEVLSNTGNAGEVRAAAAVALGQISGSAGTISGDAFAALEAALTDDDADVASAAAKALGMASLSAEQRTQLLSNKRPTTSGISGE